MSFTDKDVLITGGAGFIGSNLAIRLAELGARVTVIDSMLPDYGGNLFNLEPVRNRIALNFSDIRDQYSLSYLVKGKDFIFNLAGQVSHQDSMNDPLMDMEINVRAQLSLLDVCRRFNPEAIIVYASTRQFYGQPQYVPVDERHPINPPDVNGINKFAGEQYHLLYSRVHGLKTVSLRLTNTYGPRQLIKNARQGFIGWFVNRAITGNAIQLFGGGDQVRDFNHVDDVVEAFLMAAATPACYGGYFNLSGEKASLGKVADILVAASGKGSVEKIPFPAERKKIDIGDFWGSSELFSGLTSWKPAVSLSDGLETTIGYYRDHAARYLETA
ncbi:MAG: NAD-dependent epimerase/dehydratase family protein [Nitrospirae bacterium]|nr:NAD-dependent epimerase/dehydratase family protein [Nitrospirota bacterium]